MTSKHRYSMVLILILQLFFCSTTLFAANAPITVEADHMSSLENENSVLFTGNVDARQAEVRIRADEMTVFYSEKTATQKQEVERLQCTGNVEITKGGWLGTGKKMDYLAKDRKVVLSGNAKAWQDTNLVSGETIIYYLDEGRSEVVGGRPSTTVGGDSRTKKPGRVKATLTPQ